MNLRLKKTTLAPLAFMFTMACGVPPAETDTAREAEENDDARLVAPEVINIGSDELSGARAVFDLDTTIVRFIEPSSELPLDRVQVLANGFAPEDLDHIIARCNELNGYEVTGGDAFVVGQGEAILGSDMTHAGTCAVCGFAVICPGMCRQLGPGVPPDARYFDDGDPRDDADANVTSGDGNGGDTGTDSGGSGTDAGGGSGSGSNAGNTSGGSAGDSSSGGSSGGSGGSHGGVGNPGG